VRYSTVLRGFERRARAMAVLRRKKLTLRQIGARYRISPQRVKQILDRLGET
jgi:DNA-directed RNA polymerase sigma subunit (sigma70/sigma32)